MTTATQCSKEDMDVELFLMSCSLQNCVSMPEMHPRIAGSNPTNFTLCICLSSERGLIAKGRVMPLPSLSNEIH